MKSKLNFLYILLLPMILLSAVKITDVNCKVEFKGVFTKNVFEITMKNDSERDSAEFICNFSANSSSFVRDMWLTINNEYVKAETLPRQTATRIYERIVGRKIDPALLTTNGYGFYKLSVYPFRKNEERKVKIELYSMLDCVDTLYSYKLNFYERMYNNFFPITLNLTGEIPGSIKESIYHQNCDMSIDGFLRNEIVILEHNRFPEHQNLEIIPEKQGNIRIYTGNYSYLWNSSFTECNENFIYLDDYSYNYRSQLLIKLYFYSLFPA